MGGAKVCARGGVARQSTIRFGDELKGHHASPLPACHPPLALPVRWQWSEGPSGRCSAGGGTGTPDQDTQRVNGENTPRKAAKHAHRAAAVVNKDRLVRLDGVVCCESVDTEQEGAGSTGTLMSSTRSGPCRASTAYPWCTPGRSRRWNGRRQWCRSRTWAGRGTMRVTASRMKSHAPRRDNRTYHRPV